MDTVKHYRNSQILADTSAVEISQNLNQSPPASSVMQETLHKYATSDFDASSCDDSLVKTHFTGDLQQAKAKYHHSPQ